MEKEDACLYCEKGEAKADGVCSDECRIAYAEEQEQEIEDE